MKHVVLALPVVAVLTAVVLPGAPGRSAEPGVCDLMTPSRMLENPGLAREYAAALRSGDAGEIQRVEAMLREIRAAHGCDGEIALPATPATPQSAPALPPGHPPIDAPHAPSSAPIIEAPGTVTI
jgi:hypothetical protein